METSAKDDVNVQQIFVDLSKKIIIQEPGNNNKKVYVQANTSREKSNGKGCC